MPRSPPPQSWKPNKHLRQTPYFLLLVFHFLLTFMWPCNELPPVVPEHIFSTNVSQNTQVFLSHWNSDSSLTSTISLTWRYLKGTVPDLTPLPISSPVSASSASALPSGCVPSTSESADLRLSPRSFPQPQLPHHPWVLCFAVGGLWQFPLRGSTLLHGAGTCASMTSPPYNGTGSCLPYLSFELPQQLLKWLSQPQTFLLSSLMSILPD